MNKKTALFLGLLWLAITISPASAFDESLAKRLSDVLIQGPSEGHWQVHADEVNEWIQDKRNDFLIVDVRPNPDEYAEGHIPGAIYIPYYEILLPENLKKLPKDKRIVLACVTGQTQALPVVALRLLGYDVRMLSFGYSSWIKGYRGGERMKQVIDNAYQVDYPLVK